MFENEEDPWYLQDLLNNVYLAGEAYGEGKFEGTAKALFSGVSVWILNHSLDKLSREKNLSSYEILSLQFLYINDFRNFLADPVYQFFSKWIVKDNQCFIFRTIA